MKVFITLFFLLVTQLSFSQFQFDGFANRDTQNNSVYLSVIEDFRKISGVFPEQILAKATLDSTGYFIFKGDNLPIKNRIYRIHIDTCNENEQNTTHFSGHCPNSKEIVFIANNVTQLSFPLSFDQEAFCKVDSNNEKANVFLKIDSLKNDMRFAFGTFRSEANRKINSKKWFTTLQDYGELLDEPLAELYIFSFLSNRSNNLYSYYLKDLKENSYYLKLLYRLKEKYPNSSYTLQYENELEADLFLVNNDKDKLFSWWVYVMIIVLFLSVFINFYLFRKNKNLKKDSFSKEKLTNQEQKTLSLILTDKSNKEIASELFISVSTVKSHINNLYKKLNVTSREEVKSLKL
ncbi:MAG: DNA-binding CsgD family transcriptional regulator [Flavobacteriaceae bacterium]|jgi:DNA-binding CsgD family transcriptional regulator